MCAASLNQLLLFRKVGLGGGMGGSVKMLAQLSSGKLGVIVYILFSITSWFLNRETRSACSTFHSLLLPQANPCPKTNQPKTQTVTPFSFQIPTLRMVSLHFCLVVVHSLWVSVGLCQRPNYRLKRAARVAVIKFVHRQLSSSRSVTITVSASAAICESSVLSKVRADLDHQLKQFSSTQMNSSVSNL